MDRDLFGHVCDPVQLAIDRLQQFEPPEGYHLAFGGGKDSVVLLWLAQRAGVKFDAHFSLTTLDPPELVRFVRNGFPSVEIHRPRKSFFQLLPLRGFPLRSYRWCCRELKETHGGGRIVLTGVRWAESSRRKATRRMVENCNRQKGKRYLHPIIDWSTPQVWQTIHDNHLPHCCLYDEGRTRIGCLCCPMQTPPSRRLDLVRWPKFRPAFQLAFRRLFDNRISTHPSSAGRWRNAAALFDWWMSNRAYPDPTQPQFFD